jgi:tRNA-specific 2-thiouridylase
VKFGPLLRRAEEVDAEKLATGHYARVDYDDQRGRWALRHGVDRAKDQSYSLYGLSQGQLARALFPLGGMTKKETRQRAKQLNLPAAERPDSQEICFVSEGGYGEYLRRRRPEVVRPGPIVDSEGRQLGRHRGIAFYTIGQRQGLRVAAGEPLYVTGIDAEGNRLIVGREDDLESRGLVMRDVNYVSVANLPKGGKRLKAKIRYGARLAECTARAEDGEVRIEFSRPQRAVAPGQAAVCYEGEVVALGGVIASRL